MVTHTDFEHVLGFVVATMGGITVIFTFSKQARTLVYDWYKNRQEYVKSRRNIPVVLNTIKETMDVMDKRLQKVENEVSPNGGGSMKDALRIVKAEIEAANWLHYRPTFRTTSSGVNTFVNEAYCNLCGVTSDELMKLGWRNFAADDTQGDEFMRRWLTASKECSQFSGRLKFKDNANNDKGEWLIKIRPLGPLDSNENEYLWHGSLYPYNQKAIEYSNTHNIPLN